MGKCNNGFVTADEWLGSLTDIVLLTELFYFLYINDQQSNAGVNL